MSQTRRAVSSFELMQEPDHRLNHFICPPHRKSTRLAAESHWSPGLKRPQIDVFLLSSSSSSSRPNRTVTWSCVMQWTAACFGQHRDLCSTATLSPLDRGYRERERERERKRIGCHTLAQADRCCRWLRKSLSLSLSLSLCIMCCRQCPPAQTDARWYNNLILYRFHLCVCVSVYLCVLYTANHTHTQGHPVICTALVQERTEQYYISYVWTRIVHTFTDI